MEPQMSPLEAEVMLNKKLGAKTSRRTILNYEHGGLMPKAWRSENGKETYYTQAALAEFYASWSLIHSDFTGVLPCFENGENLRLNNSFVRGVRSMALGLSAGAGNPIALGLVKSFADAWTVYRDMALAKMRGVLSD